MTLTLTSADDTVIDASLTEQDLSYDLCRVGIELEFPMTQHPEDVPAVYGEDSTNLRNHFGRGADWDVGVDGIGDRSYMGSDHVGAEITSPILDLHSTDPELWYHNTIEKCENAGFHYGATGHGATTFGQHLHLSSLTKEQRAFLANVSKEPFMMVFVCSSVAPDNLLPWRQGGVAAGRLDPEDDRTTLSSTYDDDNGHWEWRLPEPVLPHHFGMVIHFLRLLEVDGPETAREYAYERVMERDDRITAVQQYRILREAHGDALTDNLVDFTGDGTSEYRGYGPHLGELLNDRRDFFVKLMEDEY